MSRHKVSLWTAIGAQGFTWAVLAFLAFWPYSYQGTSAIAVATNPDLGSRTTLQRRDSPTSFDQQEFNASLIDVNGPIVLISLLVPIAITGIALSAVAFQGLNRGLRKRMLWGSAVLMLIFCLLALFSVGVFYVPAAVALIVAAIAGIERPQPQGEPSHQ